MNCLIVIPTKGEIILHMLKNLIIDENCKNVSKIYLNNIEKIK